MRLFKPAEQSWHAEVEVEGGGLQSINLLCDTREEAEQLARNAKIPQLEASSKAHRLTAEVAALIAAGRPVTAGDAFAEWCEWMDESSIAPRTRSNHAQSVAQWMRKQSLWSGSVASIEQRHVHAWVNPAPPDPDAKIKMGSRSARLASVRAFMRYCSIKRYVLSDPSALVRVDHRRLMLKQKEKARKKVLSDEQFLSVLQVASTYDSHSVSPGFCVAALVIGRDIGIRLSDICSLEWAAFDLDGMTVTVWQEKTGKRIQIPATNRVSDLVSSWGGGDENYLFPVEREILLHPTRRAILPVMFTRIMRRAGLGSGYSFHSLRSTHATTLANNGATMEEVARALGHSSPEMARDHYVVNPRSAVVAAQG